MGILFKSAKATALAIPALILFFILLFPPSTGRQFDETMGWMLIMTMFRLFADSCG